jgi:hypothetical protein
MSLNRLKELGFHSLVNNYQGINQKAEYENRKFRIKD